MNTKKEFTKEEFLARCATAYDAGLVTFERLRLLERWTDAMMRLEHSWLSHGQTQMRTVLDFMEAERERISKNSGQTLAGDTEGYKLIQLTALLGNVCDECATDPRAWWTRCCMTSTHKHYQELQRDKKPLKAKGEEF